MQNASGAESEFLALKMKGSATRVTLGEANCNLTFTLESLQRARVMQSKENVAWYAPAAFEVVLIVYIYKLYI